MLVTLAALAQGLDLLTYYAARTIHPVTGEANPIVAFVDGHGGLLLVAGMKVVLLAALLWAVPRLHVPHRRPLVLLALAAGVLGAATNITAL